MFCNFNIIKKIFYNFFFGIFEKLAKSKKSEIDKNKKQFSINSLNKWNVYEIKYLLSRLLSKKGNKVWI